MVSKLEWDAIRKRHNYKCAVCGGRELRVGTLDKAHLKAKSKNGSQVLPMCPSCHRSFDRILLNPTECRRLGLDYDKYRRGDYTASKGASRPRVKPPRSKMGDMINPCR